MAVTDHSAQRCRLMWKSCLNAAFRTAFACGLVGVATLYGPAALTAQVAFPAFAYVTVILVVTNATLGDALRGCWLAAYATLQSVCPAILCLWIIGPTRLSAVSTSVVLAISAFFIVLPEWSHLVAKRIALGQLVIIYVIGYIRGGRTEPVMHPVHVAASTALGVAACVVALLLPLPYLASSEVKQNCKMLAENTSERLKLFVKAFCAEEKQSSQSHICQARSLANKGSKILQCIKSKQECMQWERMPFMKSHCVNPGARFEKLETLLRGMETALSTCNSSSPFNPSLSQTLNSIEDNVNLHLNQIRTCFPSDSLTVPESNSAAVNPTAELLQTLQTAAPPANHHHLSSFFFLFCFKLLHTESKTISYTNSTPPSPKPDPSKKTGFFSDGLSAISWPVTPTKGRFIAALKCSLSLFFAVLLGCMYSKENGYWSGLPVAISLASSREATFKVANVKAQGTVIGTVYGVLGCFVFERFVKARFLALLPWFIFTCFLQKSKMYGQAGAVSAVIGAVLILGRKNFGPPSEFAIARIVETFIGLSCSIMVELLLQPTRAASMVKSQLSKTLGALHCCLTGPLMAESQLGLRSDVIELGKFIGEAEMEPNFWFMPFNADCYKKLLASMSTMADLLHFASKAVEFIEEEMGMDKINEEVEMFKQVMSSSVKCLKKIGLVNSLTTLEKQNQRNKLSPLSKSSSGDLEMGKSVDYIVLSENDDEMDRITSSFLKHLQEVVGSIRSEEEEEEGEKEESVRGEMVLSLSALGFCMTSLMKETREVERSIKELVQWENPTIQVNLSEIYCKLHAF